jgi:hypothetical protein
MTKRFLNVEYDETRTEIDVTEAERLGEIQDAIKTKYGPVMADVGAPQLQLYIGSNRDELIDTWALFKGLPQEYFNEGGSFIFIKVFTNSSFTQYENFTVYHPPSIPAVLLTPLKKLDALLNNDSLFATFPLGLPQEKLKQIFSGVPLKIHFVRSKQFNDDILDRREVYGDDVCCDGELGWFDSRISANSVHINYDYCQIDESNIQWLKMLIFITAMHELCHLLVHHSKIDSPTHSSFGEEKAEAGECWELQNLGGIINHAARPQYPLLVKRLYTHNATGDWYLPPTSIEQLDLIMTGQQTFPLNFHTTDEDVAGLQKFKSDRHCVESTLNRPYIPYTDDTLIKYQRKPDRKGPRRK